MAKSTAQKEAADLWRREQQEAEWAEESRLKGRYLQKWLRDIGDMKHPEAEAKLREIRRLADELKDLLENDQADLPATVDSTSRKDAVAG